MFFSLAASRSTVNTNDIVAPSPSDVTPGAEIVTLGGKSSSVIVPVATLFTPSMAAEPLVPPVSLAAVRVTVNDWSSSSVVSFVNGTAIVTASEDAPGANVTVPVCEV